MFGQGNINFSALPAYNPAPPFPGNAADNGLSVDPVTGHIVFGNDVGGIAAALLSNREIEMFNFFFQFVSAGLRQLLIDPAGGVGSYRIGDIDNLGSGTNLFIDNGNQITRILDGAGTMLLFDRPSFIYTIGDVTGGANNSRIQIQDTAGSANITAYTDNFRILDASQDFQVFGDAANVNTQLKILIDNTANELLDLQGSTAGGGAQIWQRIDQTVRQVRIGDVNQTTGATVFSIDDTALEIAAYNFANRTLSLDHANSLYRMGDIDTAFNASLIAVDDVNANISLLATNGVGTTNPGSGQGFWKLGQVIAGAVALDPNNYVEVDINGAIVKLGIVV